MSAELPGFWRLAWVSRSHAPRVVLSLSKYGNACRYRSAVTRRASGVTHGQDTSSLSAVPRRRSRAVPPRSGGELHSHTSTSSAQRAERGNETISVGSAPKGRDIPAQGEALGLRCVLGRALKGRNPSTSSGYRIIAAWIYVSPFQGLNYLQNTLPGLRPGLVCYAPLGLVLQKIFSDDSCITMSAERGNEKGRGHVR